MNDARIYAAIASALRDLAQKIGPARTPESIRGEIDRLANQYEIWSQHTASPAAEFAEPGDGP